MINIGNNWYGCQQWRWICFYYVKKIKNLKQTLLKPKKTEPKSTIFIDEQSENEEKIAHYKPIQRLKELQNISVPQDSIVLVIDTVHDIQKCAMKYNKMKMKNSILFKKNKKVVISGDYLFPIVVYCLIQSNVDYWKWSQFLDYLTRSLCLSDMECLVFVLPSIYVWLWFCLVCVIINTSYIIVLNSNIPYLKVWRSENRLKIT